MLITALAAAGWVGVELFRYVATDYAYERLVRVRPTSIEGVRSSLSGFREVEIAETGKMDPAIRRIFQPGCRYLRFTTWGSEHGVDVLVDGNGKVVTIWPEFE